jgi:serine/threonine protein kinase
MGSFGSVYKGILGEDEMIVAVKVLNLERYGASKSFEAECKVLRNIRHRNLLKIITACSSVDYSGNDFKALVYEYMSNGSLERWLHTDQETMDLSQRIDIAMDVAYALDYLHHQSGNPVIHCDLKPSNVLLDADMVAHVGDFGLAKFAILESSDQTQSQSVGLKGTIGYAAPEYGLANEASIEGDIYSYGILLLEMMTGKSPTDPMFGEAFSLHNYAKAVLTDNAILIAEPNLTDSIVSVMKIGVACSMESPQDRMAISDVIHQLQSIKGNLGRQ